MSAEAAAPSAQKKTLTLSEAHQILEKIDVEKADQIPEEDARLHFKVREEHARGGKEARRSSSRPTAA